MELWQLFFIRFSRATSSRLTQRRSWFRAAILSVLGLAATGLHAQTVSPSVADPSRVSSARQVPEPLREYMGRPIALTMSYHGAPWLSRESREGEERCSLLLPNLGLRPGMVVCDMGCGNGYYTAPLAQLVPTGHVYAVDIQPEMLVLLRERLQNDNLLNVTPVLGSPFDPCLPAGSLDLVLLVDVYHEFAYPVEMLAAIRRALKPTGRVVFVEFRAEDPDVPIKPEHKMTRAQVLKEVTANGFRFQAEFGELPWQHVLFFGVD